MYAVWSIEDFPYQACAKATPKTYSCEVLITEEHIRSGIVVKPLFLIQDDGLGLEYQKTLQRITRERRTAVEELEASLNTELVALLDKMYVLVSTQEYPYIQIETYAEAISRGRDVGSILKYLSNERAQAIHNAICKVVSTKEKMVQDANQAAHKLAQDLAKRIISHKEKEFLEDPAENKLAYLRENLLYIEGVARDCEAPAEGTLTVDHIYEVITLDYLGELTQLAASAVGALEDYLSFSRDAETAKQDALLFVQEERTKQDEKFGVMPRKLHPLVWLQVIAEELGETARETLI